MTPRVAWKYAKAFIAGMTAVLATPLCEGQMPNREVVIGSVLAGAVAVYKLSRPAPETEPKEG